eukprot:TRINITY_DN4923_c0_g3_i1.p1 TRINITY_DN4923_c0_g3~~TRINITY_DN4923_c0_g3_i1.p1  ORF type:complete len:654 (-),score=135.57 TRINITY_DN4923_c0_g3_i1:188-2149(-)
MSSAEPYPVKMRDDWDLQQAAAVKMNALPLDAASGAQNGDLKLHHQDKISAMASTGSDDNLDLAAFMSAQLPPLPSEGNGLEGSELRQKTSQEKSFKEVLKTQRNILRRSLEDAFDAVERCVLQQELQVLELRPAAGAGAAAGRLASDAVAAKASGASEAQQAIFSAKYANNASRKHSSSWRSERTTTIQHWLHHAPSWTKSSGGLRPGRVAQASLGSQAVPLDGMDFNPKGSDELEDTTTGYCRCLARIRNFTRHKGFELTFAFLILLNTVSMAVEFQFKSLDVCHKIEFHKCGRQADDIWVGARQVFFVIDVMFGFLFSVELSLKFVSQHIYFFRSAWNYLDAVSIIGWYIVMVKETEGRNMNFDPLVFRLARIARLLRFLRLVKTIHMFDVLHLLIGSLRASGAILLWSAVFLLLVMCIAALLFHSVMLSYIEGDALGDDNELRHKVYTMSGSFVRAFVTVYRLTFSLDVGPSKLCFELNEWFAVPLLVYQLFVSFAVIKVIEAVFLNETIKLAAANDELMIMEKNRWEAMNEEKVKALFDEAEKSGDGWVDYAEFMLIMGEERVLSWLEAIELHTEDPKLVWDLLCSWSDCNGGHSDRLNSYWFVKGISRLKGNAKSLDVLKMLRELSDMKSQISCLEDAVRPWKPPPV